MKGGLALSDFSGVSGSDFDDELCDLGRKLSDTTGPGLPMLQGTFSPVSATCGDTMSFLLRNNGKAFLYVHYHFIH